MPSYIDEVLKQEFYDNSESSWATFITRLDDEQEVRAKILLKQLYQTLEDNQIVQLTLTDYPGLYQYVFDFIEQQVKTPEEPSFDTITVFLHSIKGPKSTIDSQKPLLERQWQQSLRQDVFSQNIWRTIDETKHPLMWRFFYQLSSKLAEPPHKVMLGKHGKDRIVRLIVDVSKCLGERQSFSDDDVTAVFKSFVEQDAKHSNALKRTTSKRGIGRKDIGPLKVLDDYNTHWLTATHIQKCLSTLKDLSVIVLGPYFTGRHDTSFASLSEPEGLPTLLSDPTVKTIFFPAGDGAHWRGVLIQKDSNKVSITLFDSYGDLSAKLIAPEITELLSCCIEHSILSLPLNKKIATLKPKHIQTNWHSCGHYVIAFAHHLFKKKKLAGFNDQVAESFQFEQRKLTDVVIAYHDSLYPQVPETPVKTSPAKAAAVIFKSQKSAKKAIPVYVSTSPKKVVLANAAIQSAKKRPAESQQPSVGFFHQGGAIVSQGFHQAFGGSVAKSGIDQRADIVKLRKLIWSLKNDATHSRWAWVKTSSQHKATRLERALDTSLANSALDQIHVLDDKKMAKVVDSYRYFSFFNRVIGKKTHTRVELEKTRPVKSPSP